MLGPAMEPPAFASDRDGLVWKHRRRVVEATAGEVTFTARRKWYLLGRWELVATSTLPLPVDTTIYISRTGGAHGYWRNSTIISDEYFSHCDAPALVPLLIGPKTRAAIKHHDEGHGDRLAARDPLALHVRARDVETKTIVDSDDREVVDDMLAIHKAIADDHTDVVDAAVDRAARVWLDTDRTALARVGALELVGDDRAVGRCAQGEALVDGSREHALAEREADRESPVPRDGRHSGVARNARRAR